MKPVHVAALASLLAGTAGAVEIPTGGTPVRLNITNTTIGSWHASNGNTTACDDNFGGALERLNVNGSYETWVAGLRLDGSLYAPRPQVTGPTLNALRCNQVDLDNRYLNSIVPEKIWAGYNGRNFEVAVGDSYVSFGRGLSLSLRKSDELGQDTTQRGLRLRLNTDRVGGTVVAGITNINNVDEASGRWADDPNDGIVGATADVRLFEGMRLGASATGVFYREPVSSFAPPGEDQSYQERWLIGGPKFEAPRLFDWLGVYVEGVGQRRQHVDGTVETGYGIYGSATGYFGPVSVLFEGKAYGDLQTVQPRFQNYEFQAVQYVMLPTLERVAQPLEHAQSDIAGGRVQVNWAVNPDLAIYVNHGTFRDWHGYLDPETFDSLAGTIQDPYVGVDARIGEQRVHLQTGARFVMVRGQSLRTDGHLDFNVIRAIEGGSAVEFHVVHQERSKTEPFIGQKAWREGTFQLGYRMRPVFAVSGILDYTTEDGQPSVWYPGASGEWEINESSNLRVFAGQSRGGLRCVSGICRIFPPFSGVKAALSLRY